MNCTKCSYSPYPTINLPLPNEHRPIMVIGESVTAVEARKGEVMTGPGGKILRETMSRVGLPTADKSVYWTTALKCAVPKKKNNTIKKEAILNCRTRVVEEVKRTAPRLILVCGRVALQTLTGDMSIKVTEEYGRIREYPFLPEGTQVMPVMNPGVILRSPNDYKPFLAMMQLAATIYNGGGVRDTGVTEWEVLDTEEKVKEAWKLLDRRHHAGKLPVVSYDIETTSLDYREAEFLVMGIGYDKNKAFILPREMRHLAHAFLHGIPWKCVWQHGKYDKKVMWRRKLGDVRIDHDTMYMHYVLDETSQHDLGYLSKVFLQAEEYKYKMNQNWKAVTLESYDSFFEALCERAAVDVDYTLQLTTVLMEELAKEPSLLGVYKDLIIPASNFLTRVEQNGLLIDSKYLEEMDVEYDGLVASIKQKIERLTKDFWDPELYKRQSGAKTAPIIFNPGSPKQMSWLVYDRLKLKPRIRKGKSTDKSVLTSIEPMPEIVKTVLEYRAVQKEQSTYVKGLLNARDTDGRVRTSFNLHIAATGRLTSKEPNVQNQSSAHGVGNIRQAFIAPPGYVIAEIDYSGAELRWLAFLSKCPVLMEVFQQNKNLHDETAVALFGEHYTKVDKMRAKAVNFGIPYGREAQSFVDEYGISKAEAEKMIADWLNTYHGAKKYLEWCADQVLAGNYLETPFGRRRRFGLVSRESLHSLQNQARNFAIQSSSSDLLLVSAMEMEAQLAKWGVKEVNLIHDSILLEIPADKEILQKVAKYADHIMTEMPNKLFNCPVPFKTDFEVGMDWGNQLEFDADTGMLRWWDDYTESELEVDFDAWYDSELQVKGEK